MSGTTRRGLLTVAAGTGAAGLLAACSGSSGSSTATGAPPTSTATTGASPSAAAPTSAPPATSAPTVGTPLAPTTDVPVGGGKVFANQKVVVTQPTAGQFKAFSATCTHMGCTVGSVANGTIDCPCHGSMFSIVDGSVKGGPAPRALAAKQVAVNGTTIALVS
jgi:Rieske Fe-S protein